MAHVVHPEPPRRRRGRRRRIGRVHQPDHRRDEVRERQDAIGQHREARSQPPRALGAGGHPCGRQVGERQQRQRPCRDIGPESQPDVVAGCGGGIPMNAAAVRGDPARHDDAVLVEPGAERDAEVDDEQPQQNLLDRRRHQTSRSKSILPHRAGGGAANLQAAKCSRVTRRGRRGSRCSPAAPIMTPDEPP